MWYTRGMTTRTPYRPSIATTLLLTFVVLKMTNQLDWSWWWVTAPLWIPLCMWACVLGLLSVAYLMNPKGVRTYLRQLDIERLCKEYMKATRRSK